MAVYYIVGAMMIMSNILDHVFAVFLSPDGNFAVCVLLEFAPRFVGVCS